MNDRSRRGNEGRRVGALGVLALVAAIGCIGKVPQEAAKAGPATTARPMRPAPGALLADTVAFDDRHGLLLFSLARAGEPLHLPPQLFLARQDRAGAVVWTRDLGRRRPAWLVPLRVVGGSGLVAVEGPQGQGEEVLRFTHEGGETSTWTSTLPVDQSAQVRALVGDDTQVFVVWSAWPQLEGHPRPLEIAAFDQRTGALQWRSRAPVDAEERPWAVRLAGGFLLFSDGYGDWQLLRRSDGERDTTIVADAGGMCEAGGRWWARRDDRLLALDLGASVAAERATVAEFIAPARRHQWSLDDCGESGDEVVLSVNQVGVGGALVGIDPATLQARWTYAHGGNITPWIQMEGTGGPRRLGKVAMVPSYGEWCAIDLAQRKPLWCREALRPTEAVADGEDTLLFAAAEDGLQIIRIGGADGELQAVSEVRGAQLNIEEPQGSPHRSPRIRGGTIWIGSRHDPASDLPGAALPHVVLDARTLVPIERPRLTDLGAPDESPPAIVVKDMMSALDMVFTDATLHGHDSTVRVAVNPLDHWLFGGKRPAKAKPPAPAKAGRHERLLAMGRELAELPADARVRVLAWRATVGISRATDDAGEPVAQTVRRDDLLAVGEFAGPGGPRWVLFMGVGFDEQYQSKVHIRSFSRRPTERDVYDLINNIVPEWWEGLLGLEAPSFNGVVDEAVWQDVIGTPRVQQWLL